MIELPMAPLVPTTAMDGDERQMARGISGCHGQVNKLAEHTFTLAAHVGALSNVLQAHGLIGQEELSEQLEREQARLMTIFQEKQIGVQINLQVPDKYAIPTEDLPVIDCEARYELCHAACCALRFPLSQQDLEEGVVRWELGEPYRNRVGADDHCVHIDRNSLRCSVYAKRPAICRTYDCRQDKRIWEDFEARIINPRLYVKGSDGKGRFRFEAPAEDQTGSEAQAEPASMEQK